MVGGGILAETARGVDAAQGAPAGHEAGDQGADGPAEPGQVPAVQHEAADPARSLDPAAPHALLADQPRIRVAGHCGGADGDPEFPE